MMVRAGAVECLMRSTGWEESVEGRRTFPDRAGLFAFEALWVLYCTVLYCTVPLFSIDCI